MIAIPALEIRGGACAQLAGSDIAWRLGSDPPSVAREWARCGFMRLHIVDGDAAAGRGSNSRLIERLLRESDVSIQVGGGVHSLTTMEELLEEGADRVVVGTRAIEEPEWIAAASTACPGAVVVAADVHERRVMLRDGQRMRVLDIMDLVQELNDLPLAALLVTSMHRSRGSEGIDMLLMEDVTEACAHAVIAAGGIATVEDLRALADRGVAQAIIGGALYDGELDAVRIAEEFCE